MGYGMGTATLTLPDTTTLQFPWADAEEPAEGPGSCQPGQTWDAELRMCTGLPLSEQVSTKASVRRPFAPGGASFLDTLTANPVLSITAGLVLVMLLTGRRRR